MRVTANESDTAGLIRTFYWRAAAADPYAGDDAAAAAAAGGDDDFWRVMGMSVTPNGQ